MHGVFAAPIAELFIFNFTLHKLFILACVVINPVAHRAFELNKVGGILGSHNGN